MNQTDYIDLVHKQLSGEITAEELTQLNDWVNASNENKLIAESFSIIWNESLFDPTTVDGLDDVDLDAEFALLDARIKADEATTEDKTPTPVIPIRRRYWSVAAGVAAIVGVGAALYFSSGNFGAPKMVEIETGDEAKEILLADGSTVHLNAHSSLTYPEKFEGDTREVELTGEGFFDIAKDQAHPFTVHTPFEDVTVLGTSFNVRAYEDEPNSEVSVSTGKVQVTSEESASSQILLPNEKAVVAHNGGIIDFEETEDLNESAWHTGVLTFSDASLSEVVEDLEGYYGVEFTLSDAELGNCSYTSTFKKENLDTVLEAISTVLDIEFTKESEGHYMIDGGGCQ